MLECVWNQFHFDYMNLYTDYTTDIKEGSAKKRRMSLAQVESDDESSEIVPEGHILKQLYLLYLCD